MQGFGLEVWRFGFGVWGSMAPLQHATAAVLLESWSLDARVHVQKPSTSTAMRVVG